ncbi:decaprenyl-phosphate phosphoribosyltransferase [Romboutsia maritimum]|uniref:Decaprenyl-phosphate phosphoribosyltransferase n=1 Tax=Romboutsia maritimum TaxID=2020948 RepID=A0A371IR10_9FIRM|nr:decaprenyl-phosphate phosphoribosyltransferase [Romboutsia maritimum]RDY22920.1 decaprenyl-phosphate phosphoribosyltransferase [Romboutsia maritimum]
MNNIVSSEKEKKASIKEYIKLMRSKHYIKNLFVLAALIFSNKIIDINSIYNTLIAFVSFCFISSSVYVLNDIVDMEKDKLHPKKCNRPLASGKIHKNNAIVLVIFLTILSLGLSLFVRRELTFILILYLSNNLLYSFKIKNIILLDVFSIAIGFILRVCAGSVSIDVKLSSWIILCTFFLSIYLGFGKRKKEIFTLKKTASDHRKILKEYSEPVLNQMMIVALSSTIVCYALYSTSNVNNPDMIYTTIFVVYGLLRYHFIINTSEEGNPTDIILKDKSLKLNVLIWAIVCLIILLY